MLGSVAMRILPVSSIRLPANTSPLTGPNKARGTQTNPRIAFEHVNDQLSPVCLTGLTFSR